MPDVIVILSSSFGDRLESFLKLAPVWITDTEANRASCERLRRNCKNLDHQEKSAISTFEVSDIEDRTKNLLNIIPVIETHYGQLQDNFLVFPKGFVLEVIDIKLGQEVIAGLREYGFSSFVETPDGFRLHIT